MKNNALYSQLKQAAIDGGFTVADVQALSKAEVEAIVGADIGDNFCSNVKNTLAGFISGQKNQADTNALKQQLCGGNRTWLESHFPDAQFEFGKGAGGRYIKIWLDGKGELEE